MTYKEPSPKKQWEPIPYSAGGDPHIEWALGPAKPYFLGTEDRPVFVSALLQLSDLTVCEFQRYLDELKPSDRVVPRVLVPPVYLASAFLPETRYITATVTPDFFSFIVEDDFLKGRVTAAVLGPPHPDDSVNTELQASNREPPEGPPEEGTVVIGVIDDGIAFANERFRADVGGTRVNYAWLQDGTAPPSGSFVPYGKEWWKHDHGSTVGIDTLLADCTHAGFLDEEKFYRLTGLIDFQNQAHKAAAWRASHGTFVMDLAGGFDPSDNRHDRPLVSVQLPTAVTADTSGARLDRYVIDGIRYILERADWIALERKSGPLPVVINFSYGLLAGPHDGTSALEVAIDEIIEERSKIAPLAVSIPAGNGHLSRTHAQVAFEKPSQTVDLSWRVQPDDRASSFLEIWMPYRPTGGALPSRMGVSFTPPGGPQSPVIQEVDGDGYEWKPNGDPVAWLAYSLMPAPTERGRFYLTLLPTFLLDPLTDLPPSGLWTVTLHNVLLSQAEKVEAWIQRSDTPYGYPAGGRQSYFDESCYVRFDVYGREVVEDLDPPQPPCWVKRSSLVNSIGTGRKPLLAGGLHRKELTAAKYSAGGPITPTRGGSLDPKLRKPDALLVSDDSTVYFGVLAAGSQSNSVVNFDGTSVAAPQLARWAAEELAKGNPADRNAVKAEAQAQDPGVPPLPPNRGGWGRISKIDGLPVVPLPRYWK